MKRRQTLQWLASTLLAGPTAFAQSPAGEVKAPRSFAPILRGRPLVFPRDHGAHPDTRTEWWYITGQVQTAGGQRLGIQVTFFRSGTGHPNTRSRWDASQLYFAHAAIADPRTGRLVHGERVARASAGLVEAAVDDARIRIDDWSLVRAGERWQARLKDREFALQLDFTPTQSILLQGDAGFSLKGPEERFASHYYSLPHLSVSGSVQLTGKTETAQGRAWLDHEWSSEILMPGAVGWDWVGLNLDDGGALMVFRIRDKDGNALWASGLLRDSAGKIRRFAPSEITFTANRQWRSAASGATYPVDANIRLGEMSLRVQPLMDDQELDSRASTGAIYWEGAVTVLRDGMRIGEGYLEMTGYAERIRF